MLKYDALPGAPLPGTVAPLTPLIFEPGTRWQYGTGLDWTGKLVEKVSGISLEDYFQRNILQPLGMKDTSFIVRAEKFDRLVSLYRRQPDGSLKEDPAPAPRSSEGLQRWRRSIFHRTRLCPLHANDSAARPTAITDRRSCSRRRWT